MAYEKILTFTEQPELSSPSTATSTWTFKFYSSRTESVVNGATFTLAPYSNVNRTYTNNANGKTHASAKTMYVVITDGVRRNYQNTISPTEWPPDRTRSSAPIGSTVNTADYFNSSNPTTRTITSRQYVRAVKLQSGAYSDDEFVAPYGIATYGDVDDPGTDMSDWIDLGDFHTYTLDAPPIISNPSVTYNTSEAYADLTTATLACNVTAQYGGNISNIVFKFGSQSVSGTTTPLSIRLTAEGTFTPTVTVTDSRGQTTTQNLDSVVVKACPPPAMSFTAQRTTASGVVDDEGQYATLTAVFDYASDAVALREPVVLVDGVQETATWYTTRATSGAVSNAVDWTNTGSFTSPKTLYGIVGTLDLQTSHQISVTPVDSNASGTTITQTLATAFYTIDFLAGGHGIAFGQPASQDGFECNMPTTFHDTVTMEDAVSVMDADSTLRALFDFIHPVGSYYETSDASFNPNTTWGGTWVLETEGQVHISAGANYIVGSTGGEATHTLTIDEMPSHSHSYAKAFGSGVQGASGASYWVLGNPTDDSLSTSTTGGGQAHNNMQPYIVVNRWHRTA